MRPTEPAGGRPAARPTHVATWDFDALLVSLLAAAANAPNRVGLLPPGERERRAMLADLQTLGSIASEAEAAYLSLPLPGQGRPSGAQGAVLAVVEQGVDYPPSYEWLQRTLTSHGLSVEETVNGFRDLVWPSPYARGVAHFHPDISDYRWVDAEDLPLPHNPFKLPRAHRDGFDRATRLTPMDRIQRRLGGARAVARRAEARLGAWRVRLSAESLAGWSFLAVDWAAALDCAETTLDAVRPWSRAGAYASVQNLPEEIRGPVWSLLEAPISWAPGEPEVTNGQHRILAMHAQGVRRMLVAS